MAFDSFLCAAICAWELAAWCHCAAALGNQNLRSRLGMPECVWRWRSLMGPGLAAPEGKIVGIGGLPASRLLGLDHLIGNALALAIGHRLLLGVEADGELLLHVAGGGPAHQGLDRARLLGFIIELPFLGLGGPRLHRVFGGLKDACGHSIGPREKCGMEARSGNGQDRIETPFRILIGDSQSWTLHFPDRYSHYAAV